MPYDPKISEWGNPHKKTLCTCAPIHNAQEGTRGTETSKYPEEKKENSNPRVAASERGPAQTGVRSTPGLRTAIKHAGSQPNGFGKASRRG